MKLMLHDTRIDINLGNKMHQTPLWIATYWNKTEVVKLLLASGRPLNDLMEPRRTAREKEFTQIWELLKSYGDNPKKVAATLRKELGYDGKGIF